MQKTWIIVITCLSSLSASCSKEPEAVTVEAALVECTDPLSEEDATLDPDVVHAVVETNYRSVRFCYEQALETNPTLAGNVHVNVLVEPDGTPSNVCSGGATLRSRRVVGCVLRAFTEFEFPEQEQRVAGVYTLSFSPD